MDPYSLFIARFGRFTEVQEMAFEAIKKGSNCVITAPTGSGKTDAALLPMLDLISKSACDNNILVLYITPLKALNRDLIKRVTWLCNELGVSVGVRHGDTSVVERKHQAEHPPQLLITTPESLQNLFLSPRLRNSLKKLKGVIVDEVHELYYNKRGAQLSVALSRVTKISGEFQRVCISATVGDVETISEFMFGKRDYTVVRSSKGKKFDINIEMPEKPLRKHDEIIEAFGLDDPSLARMERISEIVKDSEATLVFTNTRQAAESLGSKLIYFDKVEHFGPVGIHHSSIEKTERIETEEKLKEGKLKCIVSTSSLELGIDIGMINQVIQYGSPRQATRLLQRIGRGGHREGATSIGTILVSGVMDALESIAIVASARDARLERQDMERCAIDVMLNQICSIALEYREISIDEMYAVFKGASAFSDLQLELFESVVKFAEEEKLITTRDKIRISSRARDYFYNNISVIPDSPKFYVKDILRNKVVSLLDEKFVFSYIDEGSVFITRGMPWKVVSIEEDTVFVEPSLDLSAAIPDWEGEDIPVSYEIANRVARLFEEVPADARLDKNSEREISLFIKKQLESFIPSTNTIAVEILDEYVIIHSLLGKLANEFLGRAIMRIIGSRDIFMRATPYAIMIDYGSSIKAPDIKKAFDVLQVSKLDASVVENTELFRYKFVQISKLLGIIDKKAKVTKNVANKLVRFYRDSIVYRETLRDLEKNNIDVERVRGLFNEIRAGRVKIIYRNQISALSEELIKSTMKYRELLSSALPGNEVVEQFEIKFRGRNVLLLCTYCGFEFNYEIKIGKDGLIRCPRCGSSMLVRSKDVARDVIKRSLLKSKLTVDDRKIKIELLKEAGMVSEYGDRA
ncbi:MAG: DEAD/DEAH box helicase, partial [Candidatus Marsarchaeota archaeon]|nr:DEAD/DEAH box helicase [Candidatus Marsarchaeota archaeon]